MLWQVYSTLDLSPFRDLILSCQPWISAIVNAHDSWKLHLIVGEFLYSRILPSFQDFGLPKVHFLGVRPFFYQEYILSVYPTQPNCVLYLEWAIQSRWRIGIFRARYTFFVRFTDLSLTHCKYHSKTKLVDPDTIILRRICKFSCGCIVRTSFLIA